jgi:hypothetical protein
MLKHFREFINQTGFAVRNAILYIFETGRFEIFTCNDVLKQDVLQLDGLKT